MYVLLILATNHVQDVTAYINENGSIYMFSVYLQTTQMLLVVV